VKAKSDGNKSATMIIEFTICGTETLLTDQKFAPTYMQFKINTNAPFGTPGVSFGTFYQIPKNYLLNFFKFTPGSQSKQECQFQNF
jgi:hypothetical protein